MLETCKSFVIAVALLAISYIASVKCSCQDGPEGSLLCWTRGEADGSEHIASFKALSNRIVHSSYMSLVKRHEIYYPLYACKASSQRSLSMTFQGREIPIILMETLECSMTGNMLGSIYEMIGYSSEMNIAFGRLVSPHKRCDEGTMGDILKHMPNLFIPQGIIANNVSVQHDGRKCDDIAPWPWEKQWAHMWRHWSVISTASSTMVQHYITHRQAVSQEDRNLYQVRSKRMVAIHLRCGDNLRHGAMGLLSMSYYRYALSVARSVMPSNTSIEEFLIFTDASREGEWGEVCGQALDQLEELVKKESQKKTVKVMTEAGVAQSFATMHSAAVLLCSVSTFCFFAGTGGGTLLMPVGPDFVIGLPSPQQEKGGISSAISSGSSFGQKGTLTKGVYSPLHNVIAIPAQFYRPEKNSTKDFINLLANAVHA